MADEPPSHAALSWGSSRYYAARVHLFHDGARASLCGLPVHRTYPRRPTNLLVCPECALAYVMAVFPAG